MPLVTFRVSEQLLRDVLLRLGRLDATIVGAHVEGHAVALVLDAPDFPEDVIEIEPRYSRSPLPDPVCLTGISLRYADGRWEHPQNFDATRQVENTR